MGNGDFSYASALKRNSNAFRAASSLTRDCSERCRFFDAIKLPSKREFRNSHGIGTVKEDGGRGGRQGPAWPVLRASVYSRDPTVCSEIVPAPITNSHLADRPFQEATDSQHVVRRTVISGLPKVTSSQEWCSCISIAVPQPGESSRAALCETCRPLFQAAPSSSG